MTSPFQPACEIAVASAARVYEHGWQSFSPSHAYRIGERPLRPASERNRILNYRHDSAPGADTYFGEGLLAVEDAFGATHVISGVDPFATATRIRAQVREGRRAAGVVVDADGPVQVTTIAGGLDGALATWAAEAAAGAGVPAPRPAPTAWCSWYTYGGGVRPDDVLENLAAMDALELPVDVVQVDDGYSAGIGDWLVPSARFGDLAGLVGRIRDSGRRAGIWIAPFLAGADSALVAEHPDWLVRRPHGAPVHAGNNWGRDLCALDVTHPDAAAWLHGVVTTFVGWGVDYLKADFLAAGAVPGLRHSGADPVTAYREGLRLLRDALGPDAHLLGCGAPVLPSVGLVDSLRVSADTDAEMEPGDGDYSQPSQAAARLGGRGRQFMNGVLFVNDPDCLIVAEHVADRRGWADHVAATRGAVVSSDRLGALDAWGLDRTRQLLTAAAAGWPEA